MKDRTQAALSAVTLEAQYVIKARQISGKELRSKSGDAASSKVIGFQSSLNDSVGHRHLQYH